MENKMEKEMNVKILSHEDKTAKTGKDYTRFQTNEGWMSAFEKEIIAKLKEYEGSVVRITVAIDAEKGWKNIRAFHGLSDVGIPMPAEEVKTEKIGVLPTEAASWKSEPNRNATIYSSYAKDVFCALVGQESVPTTKPGADILMKMSIELVNQAKKAFE